MKYTGATPCRVPGVGNVEPGSTFDFPAGTAPNLARDPLFDFAAEGKEKKDKHKTTKGTKGTKDKETYPPYMPKEEKEVNDG